MLKSVEKRSRSGEEGFGLIEAVFSMLIFVIGTLAVLALITEALRIQSHARGTSEAVAAARRQMERIGSTPRVQRIVGGNLATNATGYNESLAGGVYTSRWQIEERNAAIPATATIPAGMQRITVRIDSQQPGNFFAPVTIRTLIR